MFASPERGLSLTCCMANTLRLVPSRDPHCTGSQCSKSNACLPSSMLSFATLHAAVSLELQLSAAHVTPEQITATCLSQIRRCSANSKAATQKKLRKLDFKLLNPHFPCSPSNFKGHFVTFTTDLDTNRKRYSACFTLSCFHQLRPAMNKLRASLHQKGEEGSAPCPVSSSLMQT